MGFLLLILTILLIDLGIKSVIEEGDPARFPRELEGTGGLVMLHKKYNDGLPMGAFRDKPEFVKMCRLWCCPPWRVSFSGCIQRKATWRKSWGPAWFWAEA